MIYETRRSGETTDERLAARLSERPAERAARIADKRIGKEQAERIRQALGQKGETSHE